MNRWTIVPIRGLAAGKSRMSAVMDAKERYALNLMLLEGVLAAIAEAGDGLARCIVASAGEDAQQVAGKLGAMTLLDSSQCGLNAALESARLAAKQSGANSILIVASDLPRANAGSLIRLDEAVPTGASAIIADKHGTGTNGLVLPIESPLRFSFGENSFERHVAALRLTRIDPIIWNDPALALDLDSPADYYAWQSASRCSVTSAR